MNGFKKFLNGFKYAFNGIIETIKEERNIKIHIFMMFFVILFGFLLKISLIEWFICIIFISLVISAELFNTAIENIVNNLVKDRNEFARRAKDTSAGAVLILAIGAAISGIIIFLPKILNVL